ncbi:aldose epimerase family protein [Dysgonomonas macrotermitis]|uniref:Aldose 1-epimerase n=1 Tax=Dysgonomonas macrotermitis TaxID=1346286 RepID=A0A1M4Y9N5_9BACT|nr:aldose epimerase family protein [Dysgonomonas macrotermitis]SHF02537.1 aldose 1-epimerase [Dysgonomonas macrotermitis]
MKKIFYLLSILLLFSCNESKKQDLPLLDKTAFDTEVDGQPVSLYTLDSGNGLVVQVTNFGLRVVSIWTPDKAGNYADVAVGYENIGRYLNNTGERFLGPVVGRYANRIAKGKFELDGTEYQLPINNNGQTLHGGLKGLDMRVWKVEKATDKSIDFSYTSPDGEEGFPGTVKFQVNYSVTPDNEFKITYQATTDKPTVVNLSNHSFFNLKGEAGGTITDHILTINASNTTPIDSVLIPSGEIVSVEGTPFDFRQPTAIGERINTDNEQLKNGLGYDHNWVLDRKTAKDIELIASVYEPTSGRFMEVYTDQPGLQFYSGNFFDGKVNGKYGKPIKYREAIALETQKFPDSPNHDNFPTTRLNPGETYEHTCIYKFSIK